MNTILKSLKTLFRRHPVVVTTYKVEKSDWRKLHEAKLQQLANELGVEWRSFR